MHSRRPMLEAIFQLRFLLSPFLYLCTIEPLTIKKHTSWQPVFRWHCSVVQLNKVFFRFRRKNKIRASKKRLHSGQCGQQQQYQSSGNEVAFIGSSNITVVQPKFLHKTWFFCCTTCCNNAEKLVLGRRRALNCSCTVLFRYFFLCLAFTHFFPALLCFLWKEKRGNSLSFFVNADTILQYY